MPRPFAVLQPGRFGGAQQRRFRRAINHVVNRARLAQGKLFFIQRRGVVRFQSERRGVQNQIHRGLSDNRVATFTDGCRLWISCATASALLCVRLTRKSSATFSDASFKAAVRPAPPAPSSKTFAPRSSSPKSSRNERAMASASVLKTWDFAGRVLKMVQRLPFRLCVSRLRSGSCSPRPTFWPIHPARPPFPPRATCAARSGSGRRIASPWRRRWRRADFSGSTSNAR